MKYFLVCKPLSNRNLPPSCNCMDEFFEMIEPHGSFCYPCNYPCKKCFD